MSFILHPGRLDTSHIYGVPTYPISFHDSLFYVGTGKDRGLFLFLYNEKWTISDSIVPKIQIVENNTTLSPAYDTCFGYGDYISCAWRSKEWTLFISYSSYYSSTGKQYSKWILTREAPDIVPVLQPDDFYGYRINEYWEGGFPSEPTVFRCNNPENETVYTLNAIFPRWQYPQKAISSRTPDAGIYEPVDGVEGTKQIGYQEKDETSGEMSWKILQKRKSVYVGEVAICR